MPVRTVPRFLPLAALLALLVSGCATDGAPGLKASGSAMLPAAPVMRGAVSGGLIGGAVGSGLDEADRQRAYDAEITALETGGPGYPIGWKGDTARGTVIAGPPYNRAGFQTCRDYSHTIYMGNQPQIARGAACRTAEGKWQAVT